jgi:hypothetical protein
MHPERADAERRTRRVESEARVAENPRSGWRRRRRYSKGGRDFQVNAGALSRDASIASAALVCPSGPLASAPQRCASCPIYALYTRSLLYSRALCVSLIFYSSR